MFVILLMLPAWTISGPVSSKFFSRWCPPFPSELPDFATSRGYELGETLDRSPQVVRLG